MRLGPDGVYTGVRNGAIEGLADAGLPSAHYELSRALHIALTEPDALDRWLAGEDVLAPARITGKPKPLAVNPAAARDGRAA